MALFHFGYEIAKVDYFAAYVRKLAADAECPKFVQIGANDGRRFDNLYNIVTAQRLPGIVIEPLADVFEELVRNYRPYPEVVPVRYAIHPSAESVPIFRVAPDRLGKYPDWAAGIASLDPEHYRRSKIEPEDIIAEMVPAMPLMPLLDRYSAIDANILQIDTEGFDADILAMIDFSRFHPALIKFEHRHLGEEKFSAAINLLQKNGYRLKNAGSDMIAFREPY
ncbi:MAG: FkbM family methyltransferase [Rhodocyclaceae bacterium]|nr:FkbM family methyltransferase [Rhodocyclaceae bacterium]